MLTVDEKGGNQELGYTEEFSGRQSSRRLEHVMFKKIKNKDQQHVFIFSSIIVSRVLAK